MEARFFSAAVLAAARAHKAAEDDEARLVMRAAARWAAMHSRESLVGPADGWHECCLPMGGEGCPEVAEFAVVEFAAAMGRSTESGRRYLSHAVEGCYRLTRCWRRLEAGELAAWRLAFIADRTLCLCPEAAAFVDAKVAPFAHTIGRAQLGRLVEEAKARFDPAQTEAERRAAAQAGHFDIRIGDAGVTGRVHVDADRDDGGPTCTCNLTPCCRRHHRTKTTGGWSYLTVEPGTYLWRSPLGYQFLRDHTGTLDVTTDPERRRLARTFTTHFGEP